MEKQNKNVISLEELVNGFVDEQKQKEEQAKLIEQEKMEYEKEQEKLAREERKRKKTAAGRNEADKNIPLLKEIVKYKKNKGIDVVAKKYYIGSREINISSDLLAEARIRDLFSQKIQQIITKLFASDAVKIEKVEDITEKFFPAINEIIVELCEYYYALSDKLGILNQTIEEVHEEFAEEWINEEFLNGYTNIFKGIFEVVTATEGGMEDTSVSSNVTYNMDSMIRYSVLYKGSFQGMVKTDVVDLAQNAISAFGNRLVNGYKRYKVNEYIRESVVQLQNLVKKSNRYIAIWGYEMQSSILADLYEKGLLPKVIEELDAVSAVASYIIDDKKTDKKLKEDKVHELSDLMLMAEPSNPLVLYVYMTNIEKENIEEFTKIVEELGCYCSFLIAADLYQDRDDEFSGDYKKYIENLNGKNRNINKYFFEIMVQKTILGTKANDFFKTICNAIKEKEAKEKERIENEKKEKKREEERIKIVCANTAATELEKNYLERQRRIIAKVSSDLKNMRDREEVILKFTWQISDKYWINMIDTNKIGNEFIFMRNYEWLITDKSWYRLRRGYETFWAKYCNYSEVKEIIPVYSYESFLNPEKEAFLVRENSSYELKYMNTDYGRIVVHSIIKTLISEGAFEKSLYDKKFFYCNHCKKIQVVENIETLKQMKKCPFCYTKTKEAGWMKTFEASNVNEEDVENFYAQLALSIKKIESVKGYIEPGFSET